MSENDELGFMERLEINRERKASARAAAEKVFIPQRLNGNERELAAYLEGYYDGHLAATAYKLHERSG